MHYLLGLDGAIKRRNGIVSRVLRRVVNPSLLDSFLNIHQYGIESFETCLGLREWASNEHVERGILLENSLEDGTHEMCYAIPTNGLWQEWIRKECEGVLLYGKIDYMVSDRLIDIKSKKQYQDPQTYYSSSQWRLYCLATGYDRFEYMIFVKSRDSYNLFKEEYCFCSKEKDLLMYHVECMFKFIEKHNYIDAYNVFLKNKKFI